MLNQVQFDPQVYHTFITALKNSGLWTRPLVSKLKHTYASWMQSPTADVHSTEEPGESLVVVFFDICILTCGVSAYVECTCNDTLLRFTTRQHFWDTIDSG